MNKDITRPNRRQFIKILGASSLPLLAAPLALKGNSNMVLPNNKYEQFPQVNFISDGLMLSPKNYVDELNAISLKSGIARDSYGYGGAVKSLEEEFAGITGKEKAIYMPSGTMANQIAIKLLNGNNTKVMVPDNSHVFRDEADAAQSVHNKRLIPLGKNKPFFTLSKLKERIEELKQGEVFKSGIGTVVIENPVRRAKGAMVPLEEIKEISAYCKQEGYKLHLDGARLHIASAYSGIDISTYSSYFDTVYISLYKYLNAAGGAILCGDAEIINQVRHQIKIYGGSIYQNWPNAAMALHYLKQSNEHWQQSLKQGEKLISELNKIDEIEIKPQSNGTNIYDLSLANHLNLEKLSKVLREDYNMLLLNRVENGVSRFAVNASLLRRSVQEITAAWRSAIKII